MATFCGRCGQPLSKAATKCPSCGVLLRGFRAPTLEEQRRINALRAQEEEKLRRREYERREREWLNERKLRLERKMKGWGEKGKVKKLISTLCSDRDPDVRVRASYFLTRCPSNPQAIEALTASLKDKNPGIREGVAANLFHTREEWIVDPLLECLQDEDHAVRMKAAGSLGYYMTARSATPAEGDKEREKLIRAVEPLIKALRNRSTTRDGRKQIPAIKEHDWYKGTIIEALKKITGQDFGNNSVKWRNWLENRNLEGI